jgi:predicted alpha-1,6-mannanase (GH76 family)
MIEVVDSWLNKEGEDWKWNNYNDDIMWACIMLTRTYLHTKNERYLTIAKNNFKTVYDRAWNDKFGGGLIWYQGKTSKNACVNGPGAIAACFLAIATGDNTYYDKADNMIKWLNEMLVQNDGSVWDSIDLDNSNNYKYNKWVSTYNQGTYIGATKMLYEHNNKSEYFEMAKKAAKRATKIDSILNGEDNGGDLIGFKGILARWFGKFIKDLKINIYNDWAANNAHSAWVNRNKDNLMWTKFGTKTEDNIENSSDENKRRQTSWGCSAALSWLINLGSL